MVSDLFGFVAYQGDKPGAGEDDMMSSSSSLTRFRLLAWSGCLFAADMLGRSGELCRSISGWRGKGESETRRCRHTSSQSLLSDAIILLMVSLIAISGKMRHTRGDECCSFALCIEN